MHRAFSSKHQTLVPLCSFLAGKFKKSQQAQGKVVKMWSVHNGKMKMEMREKKRRRRRKKMTKKKKEKLREEKKDE